MVWPLFVTLDGSGAKFDVYLFDGNQFIGMVDAVEHQIVFSVGIDRVNTI